MSYATMVESGLGRPAARGGEHRFAMLDGWRAMSILLVLFGHLFPIGPKDWDLNGAVAAMGMVLFFILSGFLITRFLSERAELRVFIIRRFFRIVPLAWLAMIAILIANRSPIESWAANLLFYANLPPQQLVVGGGHLWSLCVEMQFYVGIASFVGLFGRRALYALPVLCLGVTTLRATTGHMLDIVTWFRIDEILAGGILALVYGGWFGTLPQRLLGRVNAYWLLPVLLLSAHPASGPLNYARPYIAAIVIGSTLYAAPSSLARLFETKIAAYVAATSYALYILHGVFMDSWLGSGEQLVKYAKRPLLLAATFGVAHLSTFRLEQPCVAFAKRITRGLSVRTSS